MKKNIVVVVFVCFVLSVACTTGDWPQYRADAGRTGYTADQLPSDLSLRWVYTSQIPMPAWKGTDTRMPFDYACQAVLADGKLFFGSTVDCRIYALDAATGKVRWSFFTDGPVRFAPAVWKDRVFVVSDDGYLYCLSAKKGKLLWKKRGGPTEDMIIGNDRMISRCPARGGVVIADDTVYFSAGIWPSEGIYIYALDPASGEVLWVNDDSGGLEMDQPHIPARSKSGISAQGHLAVGGNHLFVPTGRAVPAALDVTTGKLDYFHLRKYAGGYFQNSYGGSRIMATDSHFYAPSGNNHSRQNIIGTRTALFGNDNGELASSNDFDSRAMAITPDYVFYVDARDSELKALERKTMLVKKNVRNPDGDIIYQGFQNSERRTLMMVKDAFLNLPAWTIRINEPEVIALIAAENKIIAGTVNGKVTVMDTDTRTVVWSAKVDGVPYGLAVADSRLYVSTDSGIIYCFAPGRRKTPTIIESIPKSFPYGKNEICAAAAKEIITISGITEGYCLDLGCGDGGLSYELAMRTNLHIIAVDSDPKKVARARKNLIDAGVYGSRVTVHIGDPSSTHYPNYFANLIVSGRSVQEGTRAVDSSEVSRILRPCGGVACFGKPGSTEKTVRGRLEGSGKWTHQYHDTANTITSADELVNGDLEMLWFRDTDFTMPSRHGRGVSPLYSNGRTFIQGLNGIRAYDAYNGHVLWEYYIEGIQLINDQDSHIGTNLTHSNWCIEDDKLYVRIENTHGSSSDRYCLVIDAVTGSLLKKYPVPTLSGNNTWGYIAVSDGTIFGTIVNDDHLMRWGDGEQIHLDLSKMFNESVTLFAMDAETGKVKWTYTAEHSIRHNTIAIGGSRVYLIDRPVAIIEEIKMRRPRPEGLKSTDHPSGTLVALDSRTGKVLYKKQNDIYGTLLALSTKYDVLVMTYQYIRNGLTSELGGRMTAFRASDGSLLWDVKTGVDDTLEYRSSSRPLINDSTIYLEPWAWDLVTGEKSDFTFRRTYGCGLVSGSKNVMFFRSGTLGYFDLAAPGKGTQSYGGIRPGCWINAIPAGGLVHMPDATEGCNCSYLIKATIALQPRSHTGNR